MKNSKVCEIGANGAFPVYTYYMYYTQILTTLFALSTKYFSKSVNSSSLFISNDTLMISSLQLFEERFVENCRRILSISQFCSLLWANKVTTVSEPKFNAVLVLERKLHDVEDDECVSDTICSVDFNSWLLWWLLSVNNELNYLQV